MPGILNANLFEMIISALQVVIKNSNEGFRCFDTILILILVKEICFYTANRLLYNKSSEIV